MRSYISCDHSVEIEGGMLEETMESQSRRLRQVAFWGAEIGYYDEEATAYA